MKEQSTGKKSVRYCRGSMTLEILLALSIIVFCIVTVITLSFGNQSLTIDSEINNEAIYIAKNLIEGARRLSRQDYNSVISLSETKNSAGLIYTKNLNVRDLTPCKKEILSSVSWTTIPEKSQKVEFTTYLGDSMTMLSLGGDCTMDPSTSAWSNPAQFASETLNSNKPTSIDSLDKIAYIGTDSPPYLSIIDTSQATQGQTNGEALTFINSFQATNVINDIDAINLTTTAGVNKKYVFAAINSVTNQLQIIDVTDPHKPTSVASVSLSPCVSGSFPQGWIVYYYDKRLYVTTRYTAGPELHIFNVSNPSSPTEYGSGACKGIELGDTVNDFIVRDQIIAGVKRRFIYMATDESDKELRVFEVTGDFVTEILAANQNLSGEQNGQSIFSVGNKLYFGRQSTPTGPELYIFDSHDPTLGLPLLGSKDVGTGVNNIRVIDTLAFISTPKSGKEFQIWNIANPSNITNITTYNLGNIIPQGLDYEDNFINAISGSSPEFRTIHG